MEQKIANISRCKRRLRPYEDLKIKSSGGMLDLFDNAIKEIYRITDDEYNFLAENLTEDELDYFLSENLSFGGKKECLRIVQNHLSNYYNAVINTSHEHRYIATRTTKRT